MFNSISCHAARMFATLAAIAASVTLGFHPVTLQATESVYDCRFNPGASPLTWAIIRYDDSTGQIDVSGSHLDTGDLASGFAMNTLGREIEFRHEVRNAGRLENITSYRIDSTSGKATGSVDLYGEDGDYIRGGPMTVDGHCTIVTTRVNSVDRPARSVSQEVCHTDNSPAQFLDSLSYCASSVLSPQAGNTYGPKNLFWKPKEAAWCEGRAGNGEGETIRIETRPEVTIHAINVHNGYQKSASIFANNGRVKVIEIEAAGRKERFALRDAPGGQRLSLSTPVQADTVIARIVSIYPGDRYSDTCLSGLSLDLEGV